MKLKRKLTFFRNTLKRLATLFYKKLTQINWNREIFAGELKICLYGAIEFHVFEQVKSWVRIVRIVKAFIPSDENVILYKKFQALKCLKFK